MSISIYRASGTIDPGNRTEGVTADGIPWIEVDATLFYAGRHRPKDPLWTTEDLDAMDAQFQPPTGDLDWSVPIQLDHSDSARDTQGHLRLTWREKVTIDGEEREGLKGRLRYVGRDAVEKVKAGLYRKLSLAIYLDSKAIREVTVTPFPQLAGATNHTESEEDPMAKPATQEAPAAAEQQKEPDTKTFAEGSLEAIRAEFAERTRKQQEQIDAQQKLIQEQGKVIRFTELARIVDKYSEENKTLPSMRDAELALVETLSEEQLALYHEYKKATPDLVNFGVIGSQDADEVDAFKASLNGPADDQVEAKRLATYFKQSRKDGAE